MSTATTSRLAESAAPLDVLLVDAALGPLRRFVPDMSTAKWAVSLARRPDITARRLGELGAEAGRILTGTSTVAPHRGDRRFADVAWTENPLLKRLVQLYLAGGHTAEQLVIDADLDPRDRERVRFFLENLVEATAPEQRPAGQPGLGQGGDRHRGVEPGARRARSWSRTWPRHRACRRWSTASGFVVGENIAATPGGGRASAPRCSS